MRSALLVLLLGLHELTAQTVQNTASGSIEGVVVSVTTSQPIEEASVRLHSDNESFGPSFSGIEPVTTGADGKFVFTGLKAGEYNLEVLANGYVRMQYGQKTFPGAGTTIQLAAGETDKGLTLRMTPTGTVSGRVRDSETRQPVSGAPVQLIGFQYDFRGERSSEQSGLARTNDRGEYRLYFVTPGRYYISVGGVLPRQPWLPPSNSNVMAVDYAPVYYPGVPNVPDATTVEVKPGADVSGIDVSVGKRQEVYRIRGRVIDSKTGQSPSYAQVQLFRRSDSRWQLVPSVFQSYRSDGSFELQPAPPGSYLIRVQSQEERYATRLTPFEIVDSNVDELVVSLFPGVPIAGRVRFEGISFSAPELKDLGIYLTSPDRVVNTGSKLSPLGANSEATFQFDHVAPGEYRVSMWSWPAGFYVKEVRFGGLDVLHNAFQISDREANGLNVVVSSNVAAVEGAVTNARFETVASSVVVLVPDRDRDQSELFQVTKTDSDGHFSFPSVPPGNYKIFAWEALEPFAYFDPEVLRQVEQKGKAIQLSESVKQNLTLTAIPAHN